MRCVLWFEPKAEFLHYTRPKCVHSWKSLNEWHKCFSIFIDFGRLGVNAGVFLRQHDKTLSRPKLRRTGACRELCESERNILVHLHKQRKSFEDHQSQQLAMKTSSTDVFSFSRDLEEELNFPSSDDRKWVKFF